MRRSSWSVLAVAVSVIFATLSQAQTTSWISPSSGKWEKAKNWDNGLPSGTQSAVLITNANSVTVTIDSHTDHKSPDSLTISNLDISAPAGSTSTLYLDNTGTIALHVLDSLTIGLRPNYPYGAGGQLISINSTLIVDGLLDGLLDDDGTMVIAGGSLITTNCSLYVAGSFENPFNAIGLLILSNAVTQARDVTIASASPSSGTLQLIGGKMIISSSLNIGVGEQNARGSLLVADGALLVVTNGGISTFEFGPRSQSGGSITVSNATMLAGSWFGGDLSVESGTVTLQGSLIMDYAVLSLDGGKLVITNDSITVGWYMGPAQITIQDGLFLAREIFVGTEYQEGGRLIINGGTTQLSSYLQVGPFSPDNESAGNVFISGGRLVVTNGEIMVQSQSSITMSGGLLTANHINLGGNFIAGLLSVNSGSVTASAGITLGDCANNSVGQLILYGGELTVSNLAHTGFIDIRNGQLVLGDGVLQVDKLVMTNSCGSFVHTGGTLIASSVIVDPNAFQITSVAQEGNDLRITWMMGSGQTNALQVSYGGSHDGYSMNGFTDIFVVENNTSAGTLTNYLDVGAATNKPARYYRARLAP